ncbi:RagB/SusD family nutrient uptake outer membrane protein [Pedobacter jeongneungensis]|uniref:RagB/SusD family nutrient uptake outer membrane protein n=1 Tax=Pedobacter jeongneungensis TaxID=947309 RepID=UPI00046AF2EA|nr:RagB/SusD family nutrient uptake outer membrane protein [Pedobacter jeongneungensis]
MSKSIYKILAVIMGLTVVISTGCEKLIAIDPPLNQVTTDQVFASDKLATSARSAMFSTLAQTTTQSSNLTIYSALEADDLLYLSNVGGIQEFNNNTYSVLSTNPPTLFSEWYTVIYRANAIILGLQNSTGASEQIKKQYTAEAKFIRAYCYFNLINSFGDVPLVLVTDPNITAFLPRETTANIYTQIIADLTDAKANLLSDYSATVSDRIGVNKFTATALLARVYLFTNNYAAAESNASEVIASSLYSLIPKATVGTALFVKNSAESIWQTTPPVAVTSQYTNEAATLLPSSATTLTTYFYRIDPRLVQLFATTDQRRVSWMTNATFAGDVYTLPFKYKYRTQALAVAAGITEYQVVLRLAEQYLIRAEARARTGANLSGALSDLNAIQARAGATLTTATDAATLINDIALENRKEFFCEQAFRWYNLKRTGQADAVIGAIKTSYTPKSKLLPIPQAAIDANYNLTQNPGY